MQKPIVFVLTIVAVMSCSSNPPMDLTNVPEYIYPNVKRLGSVDQDVIFTKGERTKALRAYRREKVSAIYLVIMKKGGLVEDVKLVRSDRTIDHMAFASVRHQIKDADFFAKYDYPTAFFYFLSVDQRVEYE